MNENLKTLTFVVAAAAVALAAWASRPSLPVSNPEEMRGKPLYPEFTNPLDVTRLEIVEFDEDTATVRPFQVAQIDVKGKLLWRIPSHDDYPADAKDQVASAAAGLMGLTILDQVSDNQGDQQEYGVVDPDPKVLKVGATGVGEKVVMKNKEGKNLLALIVGKEVPDRSGLRYVRKAGQDPIYIVAAKTDKLSTKFENWIERNLLNINTFDLKQLWLRDHAVDEMNMALIQRGEMKVDYSDAGEPKWKLVDDQKFKDGKWEPVNLAADEELNAAKLDELKTALDDLKIVDVSRKPAGLSADLKAAADFSTHRDAIASLASRGFFVAKLKDPSGGESVELFSNDGEIRVLMKDGVEYVLRFGGLTGESSKKADKEKGKDGKDKTPGGPQLNRYLFVMAEFDPAAIQKPQPEPLPEAKKKEEAKKPDAAEKPGEAKPAEEKKAEEGKAEEKKADEAKAEEKKADETKADDKKADEKKDAEKKPDDKPADEKKAEEKKAADKKAEDAERQRIETENKRKLDEYEQKLKDGKKKVGDLNARFADWYYVISDDVYRKIHLGRDDIIKKKAKEEKKNGEKKDESAPADDLEKLKEAGPGGK